MGVYPTAYIIDVGVNLGVLGPKPPKVRLTSLLEGVISFLPGSSEGLSRAPLAAWPASAGPL